MSNNAFFSKLVTSLKASPTVVFSAKAKELKEQGFDVVDFSVGDPSIDPDFKLPDSITKYIEEEIKKPVSYTAPAGILEVRKSISQKAFDDYGVEYNPNTEVTIGCGAKQIIFNAFLATIDKDDEVIVPAPYWVSYVDMVNCMGGKSVVVKTKFKNNFLISPEELEDAITDKTKWLILNSPNNPTGMMYSREMLIKIIEVLKKYPHVHVMSDDIYEYNILKDGIKFHNIVSIDPSMKDKVLLVNGPAKSHAMTGWRVGYACGNQDMIKKLTVLQSQTTTNACSISQKSLIPVNKDRDKTAKKLSENIIKRLSILDEKLSKTNLIYSLPDATFYVFCGIDKYLGKSFKGEQINSCNDFCNLLLHNKHVVTTPGSAFGMDNYFRISLASGYDQAKEGCDRIVDFLSALS